MANAAATAARIDENRRGSLFLVDNTHRSRTTMPIQVERHRERHREPERRRGKGKGRGSERQKKKDRPRKRRRRNSSYRIEMIVKNEQGNWQTQFKTMLTQPVIDRKREKEIGMLVPLTYECTIIISHENLSGYVLDEISQENSIELFVND